MSLFDHLRSKRDLISERDAAWQFATALDQQLGEALDAREQAETAKEKADALVAALSQRLSAARSYAPTEEMPAVDQSMTDAGDRAVCGVAVDRDVRDRLRQETARANANAARVARLTRLSMDRDVASGLGGFVSEVSR